MTRHHVRPDGSVGRCDAKEGGRCKFAREGALHFESAGEAQEYAAELLAHRSGGFVQGGAGSANDGVDSGSLGDSGVTLIAERETRMSSDELDAHMDRLKRDPSVWECVVSSPDAMSGELATVANGALEAGGRENVLLGGDYRLSGFMRPEAPRGVARTRGLPDSELIRAAAERVMGGGAGE